MRRAGNGVPTAGMIGLPSGPIDRRLHLLGVGAGIGRLEVDDVAQEDLAFVELVAPDDDGLEGERAFAEAGDHRLAAGLDALGDGDFALARQQLDRAHLAQIHAHGIVGALRRLVLLGRRRAAWSVDLDELAVPVSSSSSSSFGGLLVGLGFLGLDDVDAHLVEHREDVLDLVGGHLLGRQHALIWSMGDVAALLGGLIIFLTAASDRSSSGSGASGASFLLLGGLVFFFFGLRRLCFARHSLLLTVTHGRHTPGRAQPARPHGQKGRRRRAPPRTQVSPVCRRNPLSSD